MSDPYGGTAAPSTGSTPVGDTTEDDTGRPSLGALLSEVTKDISTLMRQEVALAKAELTQDAKRAGKGAGMLSGAAVAGHFVLLFLSIALWWALGDLLDNLAWSAVIVAVIWGIIAAVLAMKGKKEVQEVQGLPETQESVKKIPNALKGHEEENR